MTAAKLVLVIEDDEDVRLLIMKRMSSLGFAVRDAATGEEGMQVATGEPIPDLVVLDIMLPGIDGWEVLRRLRSDTRLVEVPVLVTSIRDPNGGEQPDGYLVKPFRASHLEAEVARIVGPPTTEKVQA
jgi:CheY-like chemotaxis protein